MKALALTVYGRCFCLVRHGRYLYGHLRLEKKRDGVLGLLQMAEVVFEEIGQREMMLFLRNRL